MRRIVSAGFILFFLTGLSFSSPEDYLNELINEALANNPRLNAVKKEWESKSAKITSEKWLPKPVGSVAFFGEEIQTKTGPQKSAYGVKQFVPFPTKLSLKGKIATKESEIARLNYVLEKDGLIRDIKSFFYELYYFKNAISVLEEEKLILQNMRKTVQRKYEGLEVPQQDLVKVDLELAGIEDKIISLRKQENMLEQQIFRLLNWSHYKKLDIPAAFTLLSEPIEVEKEILLEKTLQESPLIQLDKLGVEKQKDKLRLTKQEYMPDITLFANYFVIGDGTTNLPNDGNDAWLIGGDFTIPLWFWKINSNVKAEKLRYESQKSKYDDKENFLVSKVQDVYFQMTSDFNLIDLYENVIIPQAEQNFSTSRISYEGGVVDFLNWLDAERNLIRLKIAGTRQVVNYRKAIAQLEYITGVKLENKESSDE